MSAQSELDDLLAVISAAAAPHAQASAKAARSRTVDALSLAEEEDPVVLDLVEMAEMAQAAAALERSRNLSAAHARKRKLELRLEAKLETEKRARQRAEARLQLASVLDPSVKAMVPTRRMAPLPPVVVAQVVSKLASQPRYHSVQFAQRRRAQAVALQVVAQCVHDSAAKHWHAVACGDQPCQEADARPRPGQRRTLLFAFQWDETSQKFRSLAKRSARCERVTTSPTAAQVMVCSGQILYLGGADQAIKRDPYFMRSMVLGETSSNFILAAVLRALPFNIEDRDAVAEVCGSNNEFILSFTSDRASQNIVIAGWVAKTCQVLSPNILPWSELCAAHGCALVKTRAPMLKSLAASLCSFTSWVRYSRNTEVLRTAIKDIVSRALVVVRAPPNPEHASTSSAIVSTLYGGSSEPLWKWNKKMRRCAPSPLKKEFDLFCQVAPCGRPGAQWTHNCFVACGSDEHRRGMRIGAPCCESRGQSVEKVVGAISTIVIGRAWKRAVESRWTNITSALRRFLLANSVGHGILTEALGQVKTHWQLSADLIPTLARIIAAEADNYPARNKLRLLRIVQSFVHKDISWQAAISLATSKIVDDLLFSVLGAGPQRERSSLRELLHPGDSPITLCQCALWDLFSGFSLDESPATLAERWIVLDAVGGSASCPQQRLEARRVILQLSIGVTDLFELRYSKPPYTLVRITYDDVHEQSKADAVTKFFAEPEQCLPMFCARLKAMHPSPRQFRSGAESALRTWSEGTYASIDFSERAHAQFRHDVASPTVGADVLPVCNRLLVRQYAAAHVSAGGCEPTASASGTMLQDCGLPEMAKRGVGGNVYVTFSNGKRRAWKSVVASGRAMTREETEQMEAHVAEEWAKVSSDPEQLALLSAVRASRRASGEASSCARVLASADGDKFRSPCALSPDKRHLVDPRVVAIALADHRAAAKAQRPSRYGVAAQKQAIHVRALVPNRTSTVGDGVALMYGCYDQKKNVCRHHKLQEHQRGPFENIVDLFKAWANSLEPPQQKSCAELIALIGSDGADDPNTIMLVELLIVCKLSPKMQFFGNCSVVGEDGAALARDGPVADAFPFTVDVRGRTPRLSCGVADYDLQAVCSSTSDELALYMIGKKIDWELVPLSYTIDVGHPSVGRMIVHARGEAFPDPNLVAGRSKRLRSGCLLSSSLATRRRMEKSPRTARALAMEVDEARLPQPWRMASRPTWRSGQASLTMSWETCSTQRSWPTGWIWPMAWAQRHVLVPRRR